MNQFIPSAVMGFREGLEAFLLIAIILQYLTKIDQLLIRSKVFLGVFAGIIVSISLGYFLNSAASSIGGVANLTKAWESGASLLALFFVTLFILWMIRHGNEMASLIKGQVDSNMSAVGIFMISFIVIAREGTEVAIFSFAGRYPFEYTAIGIFGALLLTLLTYKSLIKANLSLIFKVTIVYLILQAGFLLGYAIHEGLSSLKGYAVLPADSMLLAKAYNLSVGLLSHKNGFLGIPLHVLLGWYSKPEWLQFVVQYLYTGIMLSYWYITSYKTGVTQN